MSAAFKVLILFITGVLVMLSIADAILYRQPSQHEMMQQINRNLEESNRNLQKANENLDKALQGKGGK